MDDPNFVIVDLNLTLKKQSLNTHYIQASKVAGAGLEPTTFGL
jgi:hypothetical protein